MKNSLLTILVLSICCTMYAQNNQPLNKKIRFGIKAGLNIANASGNGIQLFTDDESSDPKLGISFGALLEYKISEKFSLQPELFYSQQGFKSEDATIKLDYINIPLLAKYNVSDEFSVLAGPRIGFLLSSKLDEKETERLVVKSAAAVTDLKEFFSKTDFGLNFGLAYQLENGFGFNTSYYLGLKDIFDYTSLDNDIQADKNKTNSKLADSGYVIKNRVFKVSVFYSF